MTADRQYIALSRVAALRVGAVDPEPSDLEAPLAGPGRVSAMPPPIERRSTPGQLRYISGRLLHVTETVAAGGEPDFVTVHAAGLMLGLLADLLEERAVE